MLNLIISFLLLLPGCSNLDIIVLADYSGSVRGNERFVYQAISSFSQRLNISEDDIHLGVIKFSNYSEIICPLEGDRLELNSRISILRSELPSGTTNLGSAMYGAFDEFEVRGRKGYERIVIIISDGEPDYPEETLKIAENLKVVGIKIFGILIADGVADPQYMDQISSPNSFYQSDFQGLVYTLGQINLCL